MRGRTIPRRVGAAVKRLREGLGRSQDELAAAAREAGLPWSRGAVASLETGRRGLSAEELLLLPLAFDRLNPEGSYGLRDILDVSEDRSSGEPDFTTSGGLSLDRAYLSRIAGGEALDPMYQLQPTPERGGGDFTLEERVRAISMGEAERHAAERLEVPIERLAEAAVRLWDRGLTFERDARLAAARRDLWERGKRDSAGSLQALRGHVTRELLDELRAEVAREGW